MQTDIRHSPAFAAVRCTLVPGETISLEAGSMYAHSFGITLDATMKGGFGSALKRSFLGGDSFFVSHATAPNDNYNYWIDVVPNTPGDMFALDVTPGNAVILTGSAWIANDAGVQMDTKFGGVQSILSGEGLFVTKFSGQGKVVGNAYGGLDVHELKAGEGLTVDTGHLVGWEESVTLTPRRAAQGFMATAKTGEGLVVDVMGPGTVLTQTRNPAGFVAWISRLLPSRS